MNARLLTLCLVLLVLGCADDALEPPLSNTVLVGHLQYTGEMIPGDPDWNATVTITNVGQAPVSGYWGCSPAMKVKDGPKGAVLWPDPGGFHPCNLDRRTFRLAPGEEVVQTAYGPSYYAQRELAGGTYYIVIEFEAYDPHRTHELHIGWVELEWLYPDDYPGG